MRKFLFNSSILSSVFGIWGLVQSTRKGPKDWRLIAMCVSWGLTVAIAVGTVVKDSQDGQLFNELED
jgi:hypothetical protein